VRRVIVRVRSRLVASVVIGPSGNGEAEARRKGEVVRDGFGIMLAVIRLDGVEARPREVVDPSIVRAVRHRGMRKRCDAPGVVNARDGHIGRGADARHKGGTAWRQPAIERLVRRRHVAGRHQRAGDPGAADGGRLVVESRLENGTRLQRNAAPGELLDDFPRPVQPLAARVSEEFQQRRSMK
jgi:hypothetical protein